VPDAAANEPTRLAIVLSGGGARGAYEAGVLSYVLDELPESLGRPVRFSIATGTSIGAIHACFLAATGGRPGSGARLIELWRALSLAEVYQVGLGEAVRMPLWLIGGQGAHALGAFGVTAPNVATRIPGLLDTEPLEELVASHVDWARIHRQIESGALDALAVTTTEIATGRSVVFVDNHLGRVEGWEPDPFVIAKPAKIGAHHALASAAIPVLFPARRIRGTWYCDGGLRLNTPLLPALRLGANRVLVVGLRHRPSPEEEDRQARGRETTYTSPAYLAGKVLNALLLDRVEWDVMQLRMANEVLRAGRREFGDDFLDRLNRRVGEFRPAPLRVVEDCFVSPSADIGELAGRCLEAMGPARGLRDRLTGLVMRLAARGTGADKDLLSYLLFDRSFIATLLELGRADARAAHDDLMRVLS
jgi:NTE family protein